MTCTLQNLVVVAFTLLGIARPCMAQGDGTANIQWSSRDENSFAVHYEGSKGMSKEDAGSWAMYAACEIGRGRNFSHLVVSDYQKMVGSTRVVVSEGRDEFRPDASGQMRYYGSTPATYGDVTWGRAMLVVQMIEASSIPYVQGSFDIIEAASCEVVSNRRP